MDEQNVNLNETQDQDMFDLNLSGESTKKTGSKWPIITAIIIVVMALLSVAAFFIIKNLSSKEEDRVITIVDVERQAGNLDTFDTSIFEQPVGKSAKIEVDINNLVLKMLTSYNQDLEVLGQLDGLTLETEFEANDGMMRFDLELGLAEEGTIPVEIIFDSNTASLYIVSQLFGDNYLKFDMATLMESDIDTDMIGVILDILEGSDMPERYFESFLELFTAQETETKTLNANGVKQECVVYTAQISTKSLLDLSAQFLEEIKNSNDASAEALESVIETIREVENSKETPENITWCVYTDKEGVIIGREIVCDEEQLLYYLLTRDGDDLGFELTVGTLEIDGNGVLKKGLLDSTFIMSEDGTDYLKLSTEAFDIEAAKTGALNGTIEIEPMDALIEELLGSEIDIPLSFTAEFEYKNDKQNVILNLMELATITIELSQFEPGTIELPTGNEISGDDTDAFQKLFENTETSTAV